MQVSLLENVPPEIRAVLSCQQDSERNPGISDPLEKFSGAFLQSLLEDGALFPLAKDPVWLLKMVLTEHEREPRQPIAWLNLGLAFRRMALYRETDPAALKGKWLEIALQSFERSLELEPNNARAWFGKGLALGQLGRHLDEADCYARSIEIHPESLWTRMCHVAALQKAGKDAEASIALDRAVEHYETASDEARAQLPVEMRELLDSRGADPSRKR